MCRAFIAVKVSPGDALRREIATLRGMGQAGRVVEPDRLHVTLRFLGDIDRNQLIGITAAVRNAVGETPAFSIGLAGVGAFPTFTRQASVWAGVSDDATLGEIEARLVPGLEAIGLYGDQRRPWRAHVTLARIKAKPPGELAEWLDKTRDRRFGVSPVDSIDVVFSELRPDGPRYTVAERVNLAQSS